MQPTARSFILDLLATLRRGTMPVAALVESAALFGIAENSLRVGLTRLAAGGLVARDTRGHYRMGAGAQPVARRVGAWRELEGSLRRWDGSWIGVLDGQETGSGRRRRERRERALRLLGLRVLTPALAVRPNNLAGGVDAARGELTDLGLPPGHLVVGLRDLDSITEARARGSWDGDALRASHRSLHAQVVAGTERIEQQPVERAMTESFLLGGQVVRQLTLDPRLPDEIVPGNDRRALVDAMRRYDVLGRRAWASFLARYSVPHLGAPHDTSLLAAADPFGP